MSRRHSIRKLGATGCKTWRSTPEPDRALSHELPQIRDSQCLGTMNRITRESLKRPGLPRGQCGAQARARLLPLRGCTAGAVGAAGAVGVAGALLGKLPYALARLAGSGNS